MVVGCNTAEMFSVVSEDFGGEMPTAPSIMRSFITYIGNRL